MGLYRLPGDLVGGRNPCDQAAGAIVSLTHRALAGFAIGVLLLDPGIRFSQTVD